LRSDLFIFYSFSFDLIDFKLDLSLSSVYLSYISSCVSLTSLDYNLILIELLLFLSYLFLVYYRTGILQTTISNLIKHVM